jgi:U3 small nucleolar RNA-associated protein 4
MSIVLTPAAISTSTAVTKVINPLGTSTVSTFDDSYHRKLAYATGFAGVGKIRLARQARLILAAQDDSVSVWRVLERNKAAEEEEEQEEVGGGWEKVLEMDLNVHTNIVACDISDDGRWIAIADWYETKLFRLDTSVIVFSAVCHSTDSATRYPASWNLHEYEISARYSSYPIPKS